MEQILWFEAIVKAAAGLVLVVLPLSALTLAGLERPSSGFWPRLAGGILIGLGAAVFISLHDPQARGGLGPAGLVAINLGTAATLAIPLIMGNAAPTRRGRLFILINLLLLLTLAFLEIAHI